LDFSKSDHIITTTYNDDLSNNCRRKVKEAEELYTRIFKIQPDHFDAVHLLGVAAAQNNQYDKAAALLRRLIRFN